MSAEIAGEVSGFADRCVTTPPRGRLGSADAGYARRIGSPRRYTGATVEEQRFPVPAPDTLAAMSCAGRDLAATESLMESWLGSLGSGSALPKGFAQGFAHARF